MCLNSVIYSLFELSFSRETILLSLPGRAETLCSGVMWTGPRFVWVFSVWAWDDPEVRGKAPAFLHPLCKTFWLCCVHCRERPGGCWEAIYCRRTDTFILNMIASCVVCMPTCLNHLLQKHFFFFTITLSWLFLTPVWLINGSSPKMRYSH